jgi:hypothetical protein
MGHLSIAFDIWSLNLQSFGVSLDVVEARSSHLVPEMLAIFLLVNCPKYWADI